jgi:hypothetical protein
MILLVVGVLGCGASDERREFVGQTDAQSVGPFNDVVEVRPSFYKRRIPIDRGGFAASVYPQITLVVPGGHCYLNDEDGLRNRHGHYLRLNVCYPGADSGDTLGIHGVAVAVGDGTTTAEHRYEARSILGQSTDSFDLYRAVAGAPDSVPVRIELIGDRGTRTYLLTAEERKAWRYFIRCWETEAYLRHLEVDGKLVRDQR